MSLWKDPPAKPGQSPAPAPVAETREPLRTETLPRAEPAPAFAATPATEPERARKESLIAADLTIEGKIEGTGSVRIAGKFKGDVNVQGDLLIETGAKVTGAVRAEKIVVAGELEGNIEGAARVDLQQSGIITGDVKAGSFTVAAGARMRGQAVFGWDDGKQPPGKDKTNGNGGHA